MRFAFAFVGAALVLTLLITGIEVIDIYRYRAEVPPVNIQAKYRLGEYAPLQPPARPIQRVLRNGDRPAR